MFTTTTTTNNATTTTAANTTTTTNNNNNDKVRAKSWLINKRTCRLLDIALPTHHRMKIKESEKINKYFDFVREL